MAATTTTLPGDVWVGDVTGTGIRECRITEVNRDWLGSVIISEPIRYSFQSSDGPEAEGWIRTHLAARGSIKYWPCCKSTDNPL